MSLREFVRLWRNVRRLPRSVLFFIFMGILIFLSLFRACRNYKDKYYPGRSPNIANSVRTFTDSNPSVHLVVASTTREDVSWLVKIYLPNATIIHYVADDLGAKNHPIANKGHEVMIYLTYFYEYYDTLPDISILIHAEENPWHAESLLMNSMPITLQRLDLAEVLRRKYVNLRVTWTEACSDWINTTKSVDESVKTEEPYVRQAMIDNFAAPTAPHSFSVPEFLAQPCCNQFGISRDAIRSVPRENFKRHINWLVQTNLPDYISGRVWEHMFHYLFTKRNIDCPSEWVTFCKLYHICFDDEDEYRKYADLEKEKKELEKEAGFWTQLWKPVRAIVRWRRVVEIDNLMNEMRTFAILRGDKDPDILRDNVLSLPTL